MIFLPISHDAAVVAAVLWSDLESGTIVAHTSDYVLGILIGDDTFYMLMPAVRSIAHSNALLDSLKLVVLAKVDLFPTIPLNSI